MGGTTAEAMFQLLCHLKKKCLLIVLEMVEREKVNMLPLLILVKTETSHCSAGSLNNDDIMTFFLIARGTAMTPQM